MKDEIFCFVHLRWCHNGWASDILIGECHRSSALKIVYVVEILKLLNQVFLNSLNTASLSLLCFDL